MKVINAMQTVFESRSINEAYARTAVVAFVSSVDPTVEEVSDIKTAVSEAVTNCIVHGYSEEIGKVYITVKIMEDNSVIIQIRDKGCGIADIKQAREPLFTTCASGERAGLGFAVMETFMDKVQVRSKVGKGTTVVLQKKICSKQDTA
ncbi:MAG: anti-sigma F factor [Oscillospiraceae bacterium]